MTDKEKQYEIFSRASKLRGYSTPHEKSINGIKTVKRKIVGVCGHETYKTLDELANIFLELNMFKDINEAKNFIPLLNGKDLYYGSKEDVLVFDKVQDEKGHDMYRVRG